MSFYNTQWLVYYAHNQQQKLKKQRKSNKNRNGNKMKKKKNITDQMQDFVLLFWFAFEYSSLFYFTKRINLSWIIYATA